MIQAVYRGYRQRNHVRQKMQDKMFKIIKIQKVVRGWFTRQKFRRDLYDMLALSNQQFLLLSNKEIRQKNAGSLIKKFMLKKYREKKREHLEHKSAIIIQKHVRGRQIRQRSFFQLLRLDSNPVFFILKE
jgi:myosin heavy subunit